MSCYLNGGVVYLVTADDSPHLNLILGSDIFDSGGLELCVDHATHRGRK